MKDRLAIEDVMVDRPSMRFDNLDPEVRALALAGYFLQEFANAECMVTRALGLLFGATDEQRHLLIEPIPVSRKFKALRELVEFAPAPEEMTQGVQNQMSVLMRANDRIRVPLAHNRFGRGSKDLVVLDPGWQGQERIGWTTNEFLLEIRKVSAIRWVIELNRRLGLALTDKMIAEHLHRIASKTSDTLFRPE